MKKKPITLMPVLLLAFTLAFTLALTTCQMEVDEPERNVALTDPYISVQPASASYFTTQAGNIKELSIEIKAWTAEEGELTYQWYTFDDIETYITEGGKAIEGASGTLTYNDETGMSTASYKPGTLDTLKTGVGDMNYYYVVVTNTNPRVNVGDQEGSVQSEVAVIIFSADGTTLAPVITRHPSSAEYQAGRAVNILTVRARPGVPDAALSYQWYIRTIDIDDDGAVIATNDELITDAVEFTYLPDPLSLQFGKNYFVVEVTSTEGAKSASVKSIPAVIEILPGVRAVAPLITVQPRDRMYFAADTIANLSVEGVSRDNGVITYQWYRNNNPGNPSVITATSGQPIEDETESDFTPPIDMSTPVTEYYYAVVTNTNEFVQEGGETIAVTTSKVAKISVAAFGTLAHNAVVTVANPKAASNRYQYVRGYGGMDVAWANFPEQKPADMHTMYNPDTGLGYNINRIMISPGKVDPVEGIRDLVNAHRPNYYENVKIVNSYGGYNLASPWSPPKEWKSNNSINGGGILIKAYYQQFAAYLKRFAQNMYDNGAPIYAISISNEPNYTAGYDGCEWTGDEMRDFYKQIGRFTEGVRGYGGGKQIMTVLTVNGESANTPLINTPALTDPVSRAAIDLYCRHVYGSQYTTLWRYGLDGRSLPGTAPWTSDTVNILDRGDGTKFEVWMTEHNINSANAISFPNDSTWNYVWRYMNDVDLVMRINNENAFVWWASKRFYSMVGDGSYGTLDGIVTPRGWGLSHYAKYTIDTHRIVAPVTGTLANGTTPITFDASGSNVNNRDFSLDNDSARITAYASIASGKDNAPINDSVGLDDVEFISLVMWTPTAPSGSGGVNMGTIKIEMPAGFKIGSYTAIKSTSAGSVHQQYEVTVAEDRESAYVTLNGSQMLSVKFIKQ